MMRSMKPPTRSISSHCAHPSICRDTRNSTRRCVDTLHTNNGPVVGTVPSYFELDSRLAWHASDRLEFSLVGQNLLHNRHPEYGFPEPSRPEIERSAYGKFTWRY